MPIFTPPTIDEGIPNGGPLWRYYTLTKGITVLVSGSTVTEVQYPDQESLTGYDYVYMGGRDHVISDAEAATLTAAGYGEYIT